MRIFMLSLQELQIFSLGGDVDIKIFRYSSSRNGKEDGGDADSETEV